MATPLEPSTGWMYEVFISFRGKDTRDNFVDHLHAALLQKGLRVFKDQIMLRRGKSISPELLKAIQESRFSVVVFSENYADSSWCLNELATIMEYDDDRRKVLPVFYHVDPSDVRKQNGHFADAFRQHDHKFKGEIDKVKRWREALTRASSLSGWHIPKNRNGGEYAFINKIVQEILGNMQPRGRETNLVGIEYHMNELISHLQIDATKEVRMIGIWGMGGIGKTTIAQALLRRISYKFESSSFVKDVREKSKKDICALQEKILRDILMMDPEFDVQDPHEGVDIIQDRICYKKILLILDDVDDAKQLEFLAATHEWFGAGSRIIITTRDEHLLSYADAKYKPAFLPTDQAFELFSRHAFRTNSPPEEYKDLSTRAIHYAGGLPLALKVLGSYFQGRKASVWGSALNRLAKSQNAEIFDKLKLSFDGLDVSEKKIFLDIACFFKGKGVEHLTRVFDSFGFDPAIGISVLAEKSLVTISNKKVEMHDLIQEMGLKIVRDSFTNSRVWKIKEIHDLINKNSELELIEAIVLPYKEYSDDKYDEKLGFSPDVFYSLKNLRLLDIEQKFISYEPTFFPEKLQWLSWYGYPFSSLPVADMCKLVGLQMHLGDNEHLWMGRKIMPNLRFIHLNCMDCLTTFPDISGAPNLERLVMSHCMYLQEVHPSIGCHKRLVYLDMTGCNMLKGLVPNIEMESLETLILSNCYCLERFPEVSPSF
uniref:disease resistance protein Roq1-like n=1 Tax=Erigeron canadensis TaxID=72917 RepID=UPI001CB8EA11|nr:disease resistance protein Roq1-like [Erigeron canadensis]